MQRSSAGCGPSSNLFDLYGVGCSSFPPSCPVATNWEVNGKTLPYSPCPEVDQNASFGLAVYYGGRSTEMQTAQAVIGALFYLARETRRPASENVKARSHSGSRINRSIFNVYNPRTPPRRAPIPLSSPPPLALRQTPLRTAASYHRFMRRRRVSSSKETNQAGWIS